MAKEKVLRRPHFPSRRRLIQLYAALLFNAHIKGYIKGDIYTGPLKNACVPGLNCYSCPGAVGACPLGALQNALASSNKRAPYFMFGILLLLGLTFGRTICGFLCPFGLIQELLSKINVPKLKKSRVTLVLSYLKYVILGVFVVLIPLRYAAQSYPVPAFCKYICPAGTLEGAVGLLSNPVNYPKFSMLNILFTRKFIIAVVIILACIFIYRAFCRFICPLGAIYGLFSRISLLGVRVDEHKCVDCGKCVSACKMDIRHVGDHECIHCGECIKECPVGAISYKLGSVTLGSNIPEEGRNNNDSKVTVTTRRRLSTRAKAGIGWTVALIVLVFVIWFVNKPENNEKADTAQSQEQTELMTGVETDAKTDDAGTGSDTGLNSPDASSGTSGNEANASNAVSGTSSDATVSSDTLAGSGVSAFGDATDAGSSEDTALVGMNVGDLCPDFTAPVYGSDTGFTLSDHLGKVVVINFWATWCTPCCAELPNFDELYANYGDDVEVIALHSDLVTDDVEEYLAGFDYNIPFGLDETGEIISSLGGSTMLPMTVIVDQTGHITYNAVGSMTYEKLEGLVKPLLEDK